MKNDDLYFVRLCGCCFVERRDLYCYTMVTWRVFLRGVCIGEMSSATAATNTTLWEGCQQQ